MSGLVDKKLASLFEEDPRGAEYGVWYVYAGCALLCFAKENTVGELWKQLPGIIGDDHTKQCTAARRLREGLLKSSPLVGFPRSINGLAALRASLKEHSPAVAEELDQDHSMRDPISKEDRQKRGREFFSKVYAKVTDKVLHNMNASSGSDLGEFAITCIYGDLMAEERVLNAKETGLMEFVDCYASMAAPQAKGHMYGARNLGNSGKEIQAGIELVELVAKEVGFSFSKDGMDFVEKVKGW